MSVVDGLLETAVGLLGALGAVLVALAAYEKVRAEREARKSTQPPEFPSATRTGRARKLLVIGAASGFLALVLWCWPYPKAAVRSSLYQVDLVRNDRYSAYEFPVSGTSTAVCRKNLILQVCVLPPQGGDWTVQNALAPRPDGTWVTPMAWIGDRQNPIHPGDIIAVSVTMVRVTDVRGQDSKVVDPALLAGITESRVYDIRVRSIRNSSELSRVP